MEHRTVLAAVMAILLLLFIFESLHFSQALVSLPTRPSAIKVQDTLLQVAPKQPPPPPPPPYECSGLMDDALITLKTGGVVTYARLPVHLDTTLRCIQNYLIVSDNDAEVGRYNTVDVISDLDNVTLQHHDFDLYREQNQQSIYRGELSSLAHDTNGWNLDKYKFIPSIRRAWLEAKDNEKINWFVFMEDDTAIHWDNVRRLLDHYSSEQDPRHSKLFLGSLSLINDKAFAHGGSGYILSRHAMEETVGKSPDEWLAKWGPKALHECCGDYLLARALEEDDIHLVNAYPTLSGYKLATADFHDGLWCQPFATMHHTSPQFIANLWSLGKEASKYWNRPTVSL